MITIAHHEHLTIYIIQSSCSTYPLKYHKNCVKWPLSKRQKILVFKTNYRLMQVKSIAECSNGSIMQSFQPSLSYHLSSRSVFCLFLSGCFTQVLLFLLTVAAQDIFKKYWHLTLYLIEMPFKAFAKQSRLRSGSSCKSCLIRVYSVCLNLILHK